MSVAHLIALSMGIRNLITRPDARGDVHVFSDSQSGLQLITDVSIHTSQAQSVMTTQEIATWLDSHPSNRLHLHWMPGHEGIPQNETVDAAALYAIAHHPAAYAATTIAWSRHHCTTDATATWAQLCRSKKYRGHSFLTTIHDPSPSTKKGSRFIQLFEDIRTVARAA